MSTQRILLVCDGAISFLQGDAGLSVLETSLRDKSELGGGFVLETRLRVRQAVFHELVTHSNGATVRDFDQVWIFASSEAPPLDAADSSALLEFMRLGGGVFFTGDHGKLGNAIGANVQRIRQLGKWGDSPVAGSGRVNTLIPSCNVQGNTGPDEVVKPIFAHVARAGSMVPSAQVHPLMRHAYSCILRWLPSHGHEGNLELGTTAELTDFGADAEAVSTVAWAIAWDQEGKKGDDGGSIIAPRMVPVINCFDPKPASGASTWGPIVVDSTFHHFLNVDVRRLKDTECKSHWHSYLTNLLAFLTPRSTRSTLAQFIKGRLREHIDVIEVLPAQADALDQYQQLSLQQTLKSVLTRHPYSHRLLMREAGVQCPVTHCVLLAKEIGETPLHE